MDVESSYFYNNDRNDSYWTGQYGEVHNSVIYKLTTYYPVYSTSYSVNANYNWWGNTNLDYNKKVSLPSNVVANNWLYLTANTNKNSLFVGESANININLNNYFPVVQLASIQIVNCRQSHLLQLMKVLLIILVLTKVLVYICMLLNPFQWIW